MSDLEPTTVEPSRFAKIADRVPVEAYQPPGGFFLVLLVVASLVVLYSSTYPGGIGLLAGIAAFLFFLVMAALWGIRLLGWILYGRRGGRTLRHPWRFLIAPVGGLVMALLIVTAAPLQARFLLSRSAFDRERQADTQAYTEKRVGLYTITREVRVGEMTFFFEAHGTTFSSAGFAHLPDGPTRATKADVTDVLGYLSFDHLIGDWYVWWSEAD